MQFFKLLKKKQSPYDPAISLVGINSNLYTGKWKAGCVLSRVRLCDRTVFSAKILEWIVISSSRGSSQPRDAARRTGRRILYHHATWESQMFTAASFIIAKKLKQSKCSSTDEWIHKVCVSIRQNIIDPYKKE